MPIITEEIKQLIEPVVTQATEQATEVVNTVTPIIDWADKSEVMVVMAIIVGLWLFSKFTGYILKALAGVFLLAGTFLIIFS